MNTINLQQWVEATTEQRRVWIENNTLLDQKSGIVFSTVENLRAHGIPISDRQMLKAWKHS